MGLDGLAHTFKSAAKGKIGSTLFWATFTAAALYVGVGMGMALEGLQLNEFHNPDNIKAKAFTLWADDHFGWINEMTGLKGDGGMLSLLDDQLAPYIAELQPIPTESFDAPIDDGLSADDFLLEDSSFSV